MQLAAPHCTTPVIREQKNETETSTDEADGESWDGCIGKEGQISHLSYLQYNLGFPPLLLLSPLSSLVLHHHSLSANAKHNTTMRITKLADMMSAKHAVFFLSLLAAHVAALGLTDTITWGGDNSRTGYQM